MEAAAHNKTSNRLSKTIAWMTATLGSVLATMWAVITYVIPDPSVLGLGFLNWKNVLCFLGAFAFLSWCFMYSRTSRLPNGIRGTLNTILTACVAAAFFWLGMEYASPSLDFGKEQQRVVENDSNTLLGQRIETIDNVRIRLVSCQLMAQSPTCMLELTSLSADRELNFDSTTTLYDIDGSALKLDRLVIGTQPADRYKSVSLVRGLATKLTLSFEPTRGQMESAPALKLVFDGMTNRNQVVKFNDVTLR